jgi:hypothetical protein
MAYMYEKISNWWSEAVSLRKVNNTIVIRKSTKRQTMIYKEPNNQIKIDH